MSLLEAARYRPAYPIAIGNRVVERVLQLGQGKGAMQLSQFADVVSAGKLEWWAQLRDACSDCACWAG